MASTGPTFHLLAGRAATVSTMLGLAFASPVQADPPKAQTGAASYYGAEFAGKRTASGEPHDPQDLTAASRSLPLGTKAKVTNTESGRSVVVEVNDRGPYAKGRILDVSSRAAERLGMKADGVATVRVQPLQTPKPKE